MSDPFDNAEAFDAALDDTMQVLADLTVELAEFDRATIAAAVSDSLETRQ